MEAVFPKATIYHKNMDPDREEMPVLDESIFYPAIERRKLGITDEDIKCIVVFFMACRSEKSSDGSPTNHRDFKVAGGKIHSSEETRTRSRTGSAPKFFELVQVLSQFAA